MNWLVIIKVRTQESRWAILGYGQGMWYLDSGKLPREGKVVIAQTEELGHSADIPLTRGHC